MKLGDKCRILFILLYLGMQVSVSGQHSKEFKRIFLDAGYLYEAGFYEEALNRYKNLLTLEPENKNIQFHCGACCLNIPGEEQEAVTYLKEASKGVTPEYKDNKVKETGAPVLTWFMLGKAYHQHNEFGKAIESYQKYLDDGKDEDPLQKEYAQLQIDACKRAGDIVFERPDFEFHSVLDQFDDDLPSCSNPVVSGDGNLLIFLVDYPNDKKIMMSVREGEYWTRPVVINSQIGMVGESYPVSLSYDGKDLYLAHDFQSHSDIFVSHNKGGRWTKAEELGYNVNGRTSETHASISKDGKSLYFTSDTRGSLGSFDIFVSRLDEKGEWGPAENLGPAINTAYEEQTPFISSNDSILFFSSQGHASIGGFDVFYSELGPGGVWGEPTNLGYPVNTTGEDLFFNPGWDELDGYYAVRKPDDPTSNMINMVIKLDPPEEPVMAREESSMEEVSLEEVSLEEVSLEEVSLEEAIEPEVTDEIYIALNTDREAESSGAAQASANPASASPAGATPAGSTRLQTAVPFRHNSYTLEMGSILELEKVAELMLKYPESTAQLSGHADQTGSANYNLLLSGQRVSQIADYLEQRGVNRSRISTLALGDKAPVAINRYADGRDAPLGRYLNRQVIISIENPLPMQGGLAGFYVPGNLKIDGAAMQGGTTGGAEGVDNHLTIQVFSSMVKIDPGHFEDIGAVKEYLCKDRHYRYTFGRYASYDEAFSALEGLKSAGYADAFIQTLDWYAQASR